MTRYTRPSYAAKYLYKTHSAFADHLGFVMIRDGLAGANPTADEAR
ncbi:hypothetical protein [Kribbella sp. NPDC051718]